MPELTEREKLVEELRNRPLYIDSDYQANLIADFILKERKRICKPLIKISKTLSLARSVFKAPKSPATIAIDETIKLAGLEKE